MTRILTRPLRGPKAFAALFFLGCLVPSLLSYALPPPGQRVTDLAGVLDDATHASLDVALQKLEAKTTDELFVVTVKSLEGMTVEEYANKLFNQWGVGKKGKDNGILVLVCPAERKVRIEVGYGLESTIPDGVAGQIIRSDFIPKFKEGKFGEGIQTGVTRIARILGGEESPMARNEPRANQFNIWGLVGMGVFFALFVGIGGFALGFGLGNKVGFLVMWGALFGGIPLTMLFVAPDFAPLRWVEGILWFVLVILGFLKGLRTPRKKGTGRDSGGGSGWVWGGGSGGGFSSGGSSGGGGGGGSSGGGGASGSW